jgi:hypothetical protein
VIHAVFLVMLLVPLLVEHAQRILGRLCYLIPQMGRLVLLGAMRPYFEKSFH